MSVIRNKYVLSFHSCLFQTYQRSVCIPPATGGAGLN